jgi:putative transposase
MLPKRGHPPKGVVEDDRVPTLIFLTVCTACRRPWLADSNVHAALTQIWRYATHWEVGPYVLMPDHLHLFAWPGGGSATFDHWVQYWKSRFTKTIRNRELRWQSGCLHHRVRSWEGAEAKRKYTMMNPFRAVLVASPDEWPFCGEIFRNYEWW